jgi:GNAT superfamily N-acetyltransferase
MTEVLGEKVRRLGGTEESDAHLLTYEHADEYQGGSKWPYHHVITATHPERGEVGRVKYWMSGSRANSKIKINALEVDEGHRRRGYGSALMDQLQRQHPKSSIDHGDRTDAGTAWWSSYGEGRADQRGRTAAAETPPGHESLHKILTTFRFADAPTWSAVKDNYHLDQLARHPDREDIRQHGIREPIAVDYEQDPPEVVDGHTRLIHAEALGLKHVPVKNTTFADHHYYSSMRTAGKVLDLNDGHPDDHPVFNHTWNVKSYHLEGGHHRLVGQEPRTDGGAIHMLQYQLTPQKTIKLDEGDLDRIRSRAPHAEHVMKGFPAALHPDHEIHDPRFHDPHAGLPEQQKDVPPKYYHGTCIPGVTHVLPANRHGGPVVFASDTSRDHAYATTNHDDAWSYAEKAWSADDHGRRPRVYEVKPIGGHRHVEVDPRTNPDGTFRSNYANDYRSRKGWRVVREMPMPEHMGDPEDWDR